MIMASQDVTKVICENEKSTIDCNGREIVIVDAYFGRRDGTTCLKAGQKSESCETGAKSAVTQKCFRRQSCYLEAKSSTFGTECTNTANYLSVTYRCKDYPTSLVICQNYQAKLICPQNQQIQITKGFFGRSNKVTCFIGNVGNTKCSASGVQQKLRTLCNGKRECSLSAGGNMFGNPCPGITKYLELQYKCVSIKLAPSPVIANKDQPRWKMLTFCKTPDFKLRCYKKYGRVIEVVRVMHGKTNLGTCTKGNTATCESVLSKLRRQCDDTHICPIKPASFGLVDLCHDKSKYLKITYKCKIGCSRSQFECRSDRTCKPDSFKCNGKRECSDGSDEDNCFSTTTTQPPAPPQQPQQPSNIPAEDDEDVMNIHICIDDDPTLKCDKTKNAVIDVKQATYGRNSVRTCPMGNIGTTSCGPVNILPDVKKSCNGKQACSIYAPAKDPCMGTTKYFKIRYSCIKRN
ncbi:Hypothetical predicted protein [Mytilus galloprovincialis]|nr:Hypothetical predicted protein [Mytilus galloprovincialis]